MKYLSQLLEVSYLAKRPRWLGAFVRRRISPCSLKSGEKLCKRVDFACAAK